MNRLVVMAVKNLSSFLVSGTEPKLQLGFAEFTHILEQASVSGLLVIEQTQEGMIIPLEQVALMLNLPSDINRALREAFGIGNRPIDIKELSEFSLDSGFTSLMLFELLSNLRSESSSDIQNNTANIQSLLGGDPVAAAMEGAKKELLRLWPLGFESLAPEGAIDEQRIREIGIGTDVFIAMLDACGRSAPSLLMRDEFMDLAPKLIQFWTVSDQNLRNLYGLIHETRQVIRNGLGLVEKQEDKRILN
jgi:acyl carrier protein